MLISGNTVHQLNHEDFNTLRDSLKGSAKSKLTGQRSFEFMVMDRGDDFSSTYEYITTMKKVDMICSVGHKFSIKPNHYKSGRGCAKCSGKCPEQAKEEFIATAKERGDRVVGEYITNAKKVDMVCSVGHKFSIKPNDYKRGFGCAKCSGNCPEQAKEEFINAAKERGDQVVGEYITNDKKVDMICSNGHKFSIEPNHYKRGCGCADCAVTGFKANKVGYVYIMRSIDFKNDIIKIGISNDPEKRMKDLRRGTPFEFGRIELFEFNNGQNAYDTEQKAHKIKPKYEFGITFDGSNEWFNYDQKLIDFVRSEFVRVGAEQIPKHLIE